jgi:hypothetical protein
MEMESEMGVSSMLDELKNTWKTVVGRGYEECSSLSEALATRDLYDALNSNQPDRLRDALNRGANPYHQATPHWEPALVHILRLNSSYTGKLDYMRPLVEAGGDFDRLRESYKSKNPLGPNASHLDGRILSLGHVNFKEGDQECAAFLLAHLMKYDLEKGRSYTLPVDSALAGIKLNSPPHLQEVICWRAVKSMTENQRALVEYVHNSTDPAAEFLRSHADHPDAWQWMTEMNPINPRYIKPSKEFMKPSSI